MIFMNVDELAMFFVSLVVGLGDGLREYHFGDPFPVPFGTHCGSGFGP